MEWETIQRPGYFGRRKEQRLEEFDRKYGEGNWRIAWAWREETIGFLEACALYEAAYYEDSHKREDLWKELFQRASEVYDHNPGNIGSGRDYSLQRVGEPTHIQDIAIRNVGFKRGFRFTGKDPIQIRNLEEFGGKNFGPGVIPFHVPELILPDHVCPKWCKPLSVECFYQDNKVLQVAR